MDPRSPDQIPGQGSRRLSLSARIVRRLTEATVAVALGGMAAGLGAPSSQAYAADAPETLTAFAAASTTGAPAAGTRNNSLEATRFSACREHFAHGEPPRIDRQRIPSALRELCFEAFAILHSGQSRTPVFVAQRLNRASLEAAVAVQRGDRFYAEARLPLADRAQLEDYHGSGWDRGHMAPAGDMPSAAAMTQSFSLANMVPQARELNRGVWADYEKATRRYVRRVTGDVYVITGPFYRERGATARAIGRSPVLVPDAVFKLVYDPSRRKAWAFWSENRDDARAAQPIALQDLADRLGHDFFPTVDKTTLERP